MGFEAGSFDFLDLFQILIGVYMLVYAIIGKGKIYENEYIKEGSEKKYHKMMRISLAVLGPLALLGALVSIFNWDPTGTLYLIIWGLTLVGFIMLIVMTTRLTDRQKKVSQPTEDGKPRKHPAFDFDDDEESGK